MSEFELEKYLHAQEQSYPMALQEIRAGRKASHWIWFIFPQIAGLGFSYTSQIYAIPNLEAAKQYLQNETLRSRLIEISEALLAQEDDIRNIMGSPDDKKVRSCMTLFREADPTIPVFQAILDQFYYGKPDRRTLSILRQQAEKLNQKV